MKSLIFSLLLLSSVILNAQDKAPVLPRFSIRASCGIPKYVSSQLLQHAFSGVVTGDANVNYKLFSNFFVGVGYSFTYLQAQKALRDQRVNTYTEIQNGYLKLGYDHFFSDNAFTTISLNAGYGLTSYKGITYYNDTLKGKFPTQYNSAFVETQLGVYFLVDPKIAIGGHIGYNFNFSKFDLNKPSIDKWLPNQTGVTNNWDISSITLCFGFYYGIGKTK